MTFTEIEIFCKGYETREARRKELPRLTAAILMNVHRREGSPAIQMEDVMPLYTDKKRTGDLMTKEEFDEMKEWRGKVRWIRN